MQAKCKCKIWPLMNLAQFSTNMWLSGRTIYWSRLAYPNPSQKNAWKLLQGRAKYVWNFPLTDQTRYLSYPTARSTHWQRPWLEKNNAISSRCHIILHPLDCFEKVHKFCFLLHTSHLAKPLAWATGLSWSLPIGASQVLSLLLTLASQSGTFLAEFSKVFFAWPCIYITKFQNF